MARTKKPNYGIGPGVSSPGLPPDYGQNGPIAQDWFAPLAGADLSGGASPSGPGGSPAPGAPGAPGFDYQSNPFYQQTLAAINASGAADAANTRANIQQALVGFGFVPTSFKDKLGALDATTRELIKKNTETGISGYARMLEGRKEGIQGLVNRLQAKGLRRSGAKGYGLRKNQLAYDRNFADAISQLMGGISGQYGAYAQNEAARQNQLAQAMQWVYQNYYTGPGTANPGSGQSSGGASYAPINDWGATGASRNDGGRVWGGWVPS